MKCPVCGKEAASDAVYCASCGARLPTHFVPPASPAPGTGSPSPAPGSTVPAAPGPTGATSQFRNQMTAGLTDANDPHHVLWEGRYAMKAMAGNWILLAIASVASIIVHAIWLSKYGARGWFILLGSIALVWAYAYFVYLGRHWGVRYQLTTQRFFHEKGVFRHVSDRIEVIAMDDITVTQGLLDRLFGTGQIRILSGDHATPEFIIAGVAEVKRVAEIMDEARRAERNRRGVRVESI